MKRPCPISICECPGVDSPITNTSSEAPDPLLFWAQIWNPYDPFKPPPLGNGTYVKVDCDVFNEIFSGYDPVVYAGTQLMANLQALAAELGCPWPPSGDQTFTNDEQTATVYCPDGSSFSYTVDSGTLTSPLMTLELGEAWVEWANAWAFAYAFQQASALMDCIVPEVDGEPEPPGPTPPTPPLGAGILSTPLWCCADDEVNQSYNITGGSSVAYTITMISGAIPPGTSLTQTGLRRVTLTGFPSTPGVYSFTIRGVGTTAPTVTVDATIYFYVMGIANASSLPNAEEGIPYSHDLAGIGGTSPYTFALDVGSSLPGGLSLSTAGTISGTATEDGDFSFDVVITDANGGDCVQTVLLTITTPVIDWSTTSWVTVQNDFPPFSVAVVVPGEPGGIQDNFDVHIQGVDNTAMSDALATGTITYIGPATDIHITGNMICTPVGTHPPNEPDGVLEIRTQIGAGPIFINTVITNSSIVPPGAIPMVTGPYSVPFTLPATGGDICTVTIVANVRSNFNLFGPAYEMRISGTITND